MYEEVRVTSGIGKPLAFKTNGSAPMSVRRSVGLESLGFTIAEAASTIVSVGAITLSDQIPQSVIKNVSKVVSKICIEPYLDTIEKYMDKCKIEGCKVDQTKPRDERAEKYAQTLAVYSSAILLSLWAKSLARDGMNTLFKVGGVKDTRLPPNASLGKKIMSHVPFVNWSSEKRMIFAIDEGVHLGALAYLNTKGADITDENIKSVSNILQKTFGFSKERADRASTMFNVWEVPNFVGMAAGYGTILGKHAYNWPTQHSHKKFLDIINGTAKSSHSIT